MSDMNVGIHLNKTPALAEAEGFRQDMRRLNEGLAKDTQAALAAELDAHRRNREAKRLATANAAEAELRAARRAAEEEGTGIRALKQARRDAAADAARGYEQVGRSGSEGFASIAGAAGIATVAARAALATVSGIAAELDRVGEKSRRMSAEFADQREKLAHLAALQGRQSDSGFVLDEAARNARTGLTPDEGLRAGEAFLASGAQFIGAGKGQMSPAQAQRLQEEAAKLSLAKKVDPAVVEDLAGKLIGTKDYGKLGAKGADAALADVNKILAINSSGSGEDNQLGSEVAKLLAATVNEDELKGVFQDPAQTAKLISTLTEGFPQGQAEAAGALLRGLRGFGKRQGDLLKRAGVTPRDDPFAALTKLAPVLEAEAKAGPAGTTIQDVLRTNFEDEVTQRALGVAINKGVYGGVFAKRDATAAENATPEQAREQIAEFQRSERGASRAADAQVKLAEAERAARNARLTILRKQALASLIGREAIDTNATGVNDFLNNKATFGLLGNAEQKRVDDEAQRMLDARDPAGARRGDFHLLNVSPEAREKELRDRLNAIDAAGVNALNRAEGEENVIGDGPSPFGLDGPGGLLDNLDALTREKRHPGKRKVGAGGVDPGGLVGRGLAALGVDPRGAGFGGMHITPGWTPLPDEPLGAGDRSLLASFGPASDAALAFAGLDAPGAAPADAMTPSGVWGGGASSGGGPDPTLFSEMLAVLKTIKENTGRGAERSPAPLLERPFWQGR